VAQAAASFGVTYFAADFRNLPSGVHWSVLAGFLLSLISPAVAAYGAHEARREKFRSDVYTALLAALARISDKAGVPASAVGLSAYIVRRQRWRFWKQYQARVGRVRLSSFPPPSTIEWVRGKGFLGECWAKQNTVIDRHIPTRYAKYVGCDEAGWAAAPPEIRLGLTFQEWETTQQRYVYIRVAPILTARDGPSRYVGCVSLDTAHDEYAKALGTDEVRNLVQDAAEAIDAALRSKA
jgi:hypothetical protein